MDAATLIEKLRLLPPDTVIGVESEDGEVIHHVSRSSLAVVHPAGVAIIGTSPRVIAEEDLS